MIFYHTIKDCPKNLLANPECDLLYTLLCNARYDSSHGYFMTIEEKTQEKWEVQLRKGTLELVILAALQHRTLYGLELLKLLQSFKSAAITEGTLYPLLDRLKREGIVDAQWVQEGDVRPRKYYSLTTTGHHKLADLITLWRQSVFDIEFLLAHPGPDVLPVQGE